MTRSDKDECRLLLGVRVRRARRDPRRMESLLLDSFEGVRHEFENTIRITAAHSHMSWLWLNSTRGSPRISLVCRLVLGFRRMKGSMIKILRWIRLIDVNWSGFLLRMPTSTSRSNPLYPSPFVLLLQLHRRLPWPFLST
jgi:hypothetical protein